MSSDAIVDMPANPIETVQPTSSGVAPVILLSTEADKLYSEADFALFHDVTGYRLATRLGLWVVVDDDGNRTQATDRLFTALSQEAFRLADLRRKAGNLPDEDLTLDDLIATLDALRRAASQVGSRGLHAVQRLDARLDDMKHRPVMASVEFSAPLPLEPAL